MRKNGFTLIELLAVIVILAIIALIATPIILNIIEDARKSAKVSSASNYIVSAEQAVLMMNLEEPFNPTSCITQANGNLKCDDKTEEIVVEINGVVPSEGAVLIFDKGVVSYVTALEIEGTSIAMLDGKLTASNVYKATPENLSETIAKAEAGSTIKLAAGNYAKIELNGNDSYKEGLTIVGQEGVNVEGVYISSGVPLASTKPNLDNKKSVMPSGLTLKNINFTSPLVAHNCEISNISINNCTFAEGVHLKIEPNLYNSKGNYRYDSVNVKNINIIGNTFENASGKTMLNSNASAILLHAVENAIIQNNIINGAAFNGIQINKSMNNTYCTGKIAILNNKITNTGSRSIRLAGITNGNIKVSGNELNNSDLAETNSEYIKSSGTTNTTFEWTNNTYSGTLISVGSGITQQ